MTKKQKEQLYSFIKNNRFETLSSGATDAHLNGKNHYNTAKEILGDRKVSYRCYNNYFISVEESCKAYYLFGFTLFKRYNLEIPDRILDDFVEIYSHHPAKIESAIKTIIKMVSEMRFSRNYGMTELPEEEQEAERKKIVEEIETLDIKYLYKKKLHSIYVDIDFETNRFISPFNSFEDFYFFKLKKIAEQLNFMNDCISVSLDNEKISDIYYKDWK